MAKVHKVSFYLVDTNDNLNSKQMKEYVEFRLDRIDYETDFIKVKSSEEFEWDDNLSINFTNCKELEFEKYFKEKEIKENV